MENKEISDQELLGEGCENEPHAEDRIGFYRRDFLLAVAALAMPMATACESEDEDKNKSEQNAANQLIKQLDTIKADYRHIPIKDSESVLERVDEHTTEIYRAGRDISLITAILADFNILSGVCINASHLVTSIRKANELLKHYARAESAITKEATRHESKAKDNLVRYVKLLERQKKINDRVLKPQFQGAGEFEKLVGEMASLAWVFAETRKEGKTLVENAVKSATITVYLAFLADALQELQKAIEGMRETMEKMGCALPEDMFSDSAIVNYMAGDILAERRKEVKEIMTLVYNLEPGDERTEKVEKIQKFFVDYDYMPEYDEDGRSNINGEYNKKSLKCSWAVHWSVEHCKRLAVRHFRISDEYVEKPNETLIDFQYLLMSLGYLSAYHVPEKGYNAEANKAFIRFYREMFGKSVDDKE